MSIEMVGHLLQCLLRKIDSEDKGLFDNIAKRAGAYNSKEQVTY